MFISLRKLFLKKLFKTLINKLASHISPANWQLLMPPYKDSPTCVLPHQ